MPDALIQTAIAILGVLVAWLNQSPRTTTRRWACAFGLAAQPFWIASAWQASQWGVMACSLGYGAAFARGLYLYWRPRSSSTTD